MARLVHEVWEAISDGMILHTCCLVGPRGDGCRRALESGAQLLTTFEAESHFDAMTRYNQFLGREPYSTNQPLDYEPYPDQWFEEQKSAELS